MNRARVMIGLMAALAIAASTTTTPATAATGATAPAKLVLPKPGGPHQIGTVALHLVDDSRIEPWLTTGQKRELMISLWYPARKAGHHPLAPWMPKAAADRYLRDAGVPPGKLLLGDTHGHEGAPVDERLGRLPVVLYSPGANASRSYGTGVVQELASRGYLVVTMDHTYDAAVVEFPGGRVATNPAGEVTDFAKAVRTRTEDTRFVLDELTALTAGRNPDADAKPLPKGLKNAPDLERIGMFGHSLGGATTSSAMYADRRIKAGLGLDGAVLGPVAKAGLDRPYLVVDTPGKGGMASNPALREFWSNLRGWRLNLTVRGAAHNSFGDDVRLIPLIAPLIGLPPREVEESVGTIAAGRALAFQHAYPRAFFDRHLRGRKATLLDGPAPRFPEVAYTR
ncbi:lipase [Sphaerisporangium album]|uniref:Lipase n=1 Tax=Sphaerisporangium album TaxID=509200 RepID=A0A367F907_9ACTN|nr:lipase [Sphaerisporangium album]RCG26856.1 lipase [Sphaerisporangium album]